MSDADKTAYIADNQGLFEQEGFMEAFVSGQDLSGFISIDKQKERDRLITQLESQLKAAQEEGGNKALIPIFEKQLAELKDANNEIFKESMEIRLKAEEEALKQYEDFLKEQTDKEKEALNERKEAYQEYFDAINQAYDDEDFEEDQNQLISNLGKLGASMDAGSMKMAAELSQQIKDNEEERIKELRKRGQEALTESIDDQVKKIDENLEELLSNSQKMLEALQGEQRKEIYSNMLSNVLSSGQTEAQKYAALEPILATISSYKDGPELD